MRGGLCASPSWHHSVFEVARGIYPSSSSCMCTFSDEEDNAPRCCRKYYIIFSPMN
jgi:hypothetical protein